MLPKELVSLDSQGPFWPASSVHYKYYICLTLLKCIDSDIYLACSGQQTRLDPPIDHIHPPTDN